MRGRMIVQVLVQIAVSAAFIGVLVWRGDVGDLRDALRGADWRWIVPATLLVAGSKALHGVRWWLLVRRAGRVPLGGTVLVLLAATGVSVILPLRVGAGLQLQVLRRRYGVDRTTVAATLVLEGFLDATALVGVVLVAAPFLQLKRTIVLTAVFTAVFAGALLAILALLSAGRVGGGWMARLPAHLRGRAERYAESIGRGFAAAGSPRSVLLLILVTLADWLVATAGYALIGHAFGLGVGIAAYLAVEIIGNLSGAVPLTQANVGPFELAVRETLAAFGAPGTTAIAFAVASHAAIIVADAVIGLAAAWALRLRREDLFYLQAGDAPSVD